MRLFWSKKTGKTHEGGGGGNVRNLMKKFGQMANEILERAKAVSGCAMMSGRLCGKPMAESLQRKSCDKPTMNIVRVDPHKL